ncbi:PIN domain-containing protein [Candidatus Collierbacteria bacterium]|nr:PIN domain-containing protein [Candidatus Collierbacteria bacterium]
MTYFIDTNVFLRVLIREDQKMFDQSKTFLEAVKKNKFDAVTSTIVISEIVWTLGSYYRFSKKEVLRSVRGILNLGGLKVIDDYDLRKSLTIYESKKCKYIDAVIAGMPRIQSGDWTIVSYDKEFDKLGVERVAPPC